MSNLYKWFCKSRNGFSPCVCGVDKEDVFGEKLNGICRRKVVHPEAGEKTEGSLHQQEAVSLLAKL